MQKIEEPWRMFLHEAEDGSQTLVTVWTELGQADICTRSDKWATWSAPKRAGEIWE